MKRALQTAIFTAAGLYEGKSVKVVLVPEMREIMSFKNTVASSIAEIKEFVQSLKHDVTAKFGSFPEVDFSLMTDDLWYLDCLKHGWPDRANDLVERAKSYGKRASIDSSTSAAGAVIQAGVNKWHEEINKKDNTVKNEEMEHMQKGLAWVDQNRLKQFMD